MVLPRRAPCALITRPRDEGEKLAGLLAARGIDALAEPLLDIHPRAAPIDLGGVQALLCTSVNGVAAFAQASGERAIPLFAVGDATAARARALEFVAVVSAGGALAELVALVRARLLPGNGRLLHIAGGAVAGDLVENLRAAGFAADRAVLYEARPAAALSPAAIAAITGGGIDFALFFSPRTAAVFARLATLAGIAGDCATMTAVSISPAADAALAVLPWRDRRVAARPAQDALLAVLDDAVTEYRVGAGGRRERNDGGAEGMR